MRLLTYAELAAYSKAELWDLYREAMAALAELPEGSLDRQNALLNIQHIRTFLARPSFAPGL